MQTAIQSRPTAIFLLALLTTLVVTSSEAPSLFGSSTVFTSVCLSVNIITQKNAGNFLEICGKGGLWITEDLFKVWKVRVRSVGVKNSGLKFVLTTLWRKYTLRVPSNAV